MSYRRMRNRSIVLDMDVWRFWSGDDDSMGRVGELADTFVCLARIHVGHVSNIDVVVLN